MNKKKVDSLLPSAKKVLIDTGIAEKKVTSEQTDTSTGGWTIKKTYRGQISTFGAAIINGSLLSAIAFFSAQGSSSTERQKLMTAIQRLIPEASGSASLFDYVAGHPNRRREITEDVIDASIALKLAMNLFILEN